MKLDVRGYDGIGPVELVMTRSQVRAALPIAVETFRKGPDAQNLTDSFRGFGVHVYYDERDVCEAIEVFAPASPTYLGRLMIGQPFEDVLRWIKGIDKHIELDGSGLIAFTLGIALYAPSARRVPRDPIEALMVFRRGYYDDSPDASKQSKDESTGPLPSSGS